MIKAKTSKRAVEHALQLVRRPFKKQTHCWVETIQDHLVLTTGDDQYQAKHTIHADILDRGNSTLLLDSKKLERSVFAPGSPWQPCHYLHLAPAWDVLERDPPYMRENAPPDFVQRVDFAALRELLPFVREPKNGFEDSAQTFVHLEGGFAYAINGTSSVRTPTIDPIPAARHVANGTSSARTPMALEHNAIIPRVFLERLRKPGTVEKTDSHWCYYENSALLTYYYRQSATVPNTGASFWGAKYERHKARSPVQRKVHSGEMAGPRFDPKVLERAQEFARTKTIEHTGPENQAYLYRDDGAAICIMPLRQGAT